VVCVTAITLEFLDVLEVGLAAAIGLAVILLLLLPLRSIETCLGRSKIFLLLSNRLCDVRDLAIGVRERLLCALDVATPLSAKLVRDGQQDVSTVFEGENWSLLGCRRTRAMGSRSVRWSEP